MGALLGPDFPTDIALAVSGGGDSMAMLALTHEWARHMGVGLWVVTVDHGLRPESAGRPRWWRRNARRWGIRMRRSVGNGTGRATFRTRPGARGWLIDRWRRGIEHVLMAHTQDDVAETFLMRLARGSGVEGLSAMAEHRYVTPHQWRVWCPSGSRNDAKGAPPPEPTRRVAGVPAFSPGFHVIRPLLEETRADLRHYVRTLRVPFVDDPSNEDPKFDRVRARAALAEIGIDTSVMAATAQRMARAREALARGQKRWRNGSWRRPPWHVRIDRDGFAKVERDTQLRLLAAALQWVGGAEYRPRAAPLEACSTGRWLAGAERSTARRSMSRGTRSSSFVSSPPFRKRSRWRGPPRCGTIAGNSTARTSRGWRSAPWGMRAGNRCYRPSETLRPPTVRLKNRGRPMRSRARYRRFSTGTSSWGLSRALSVSTMSPNSARHMDIFLPC
jgi:tRNA(Ile)-lysidine synthase